MGGKRKSKKRVMSKKRPRVPTRFDCPFCDNDQTVECKMNFQDKVGTITCRVCDNKFQMAINHLTQPVDLYSAMIDETEKMHQAKHSDGGAVEEEQEAKEAETEPKQEEEDVKADSEDKPKGTKRKRIEDDGEAEVDDDKEPNAPEAEEAQEGEEAQEAAEAEEAAAEEDAEAEANADETEE